MKFSAKVQEPEQIVIRLAMEMTIAEAEEFIRQARETIFGPAAHIRRGLEDVVGRLRSKIEGQEEGES